MAMDSTDEIKSRLPIEELVGRYCQLKKKGRGYVALCPFHHDTHPSFLISPDKGIAYCFACQKGGDIFSFYQAIEGVDFRQALLDLAERTGVKLETQQQSFTGPDEKERLRACLESALGFFCEGLSKLSHAQEYLKVRGVTTEEIEEFQIGFAPDEPSLLYATLLKEGFSRSEILKAGLGIQRELKEERVFDRFRGRVMFPIVDAQERLIGFGGRIVGEGEPKYMNSPDGPLYHKSRVLFGIHLAKGEMRDKKRAVLVEGYFDVIACFRAGVRCAVAPCGTALTPEHVQLLKRSVDEVVLCLDQDRAGREAAERAFILLSGVGVHVRAVVLSAKDPDEAIQRDPEGTKRVLSGRGEPYLDLVLRELSTFSGASIDDKRRGVQRMLPLLHALPSAVERRHYLERAAVILATTATALEEDLVRHAGTPSPRRQPSPSEAPKPVPFSRGELALSLFLLYPQLLEYLQELIPPTEGVAAALCRSFQELKNPKDCTLNALALSSQERERVGLLLLYCEEMGFADWSQSKAIKELKFHCRLANRDTILSAQREISRKLLEAKERRDSFEEEQLKVQYQEVLKLAKMAA